MKASFCGFSASMDVSVSRYWISLPAQVARASNLQRRDEISTNKFTSFTSYREYKEQKLEIGILQNNPTKEDNF